ncbi:MAG: hypothetical protein NXI16_15720 [Alphaproteobacteria bacterium]|nr:hypothetical protein [Alphaproteobacteria bacterium]
MTKRTEPFDTETILASVLPVANGAGSYGSIGVYRTVRREDLERALLRFADLCSRRTTLQPLQD